MYPAPPISVAVTFELLTTTSAVPIPTILPVVLLTVISAFLRAAFALATFKAGVPERLSKAPLTLTASAAENVVLPLFIPAVKLPLESNPAPA